MVRALRQDEILRIKTLKKEGNKPAEIARIIGRPYATVYSVLRRYRLIKPRYNSIAKNKEAVASIINMYTKEKLSIKKIMAATGFSYGGIHRTLTDNKVKMRDKRGR